MAGPSFIPDPRHAAVARHYDEVDPFYRAVWGEHVHHGLWRRGDETPEEATRALALQVARTAGLEGGSRGLRVLDVGCGYGATARLLHDRFGASVTGITISAVQHSRACAEAAGRTGLTFLHGDWLANTLPDRHFDAVIAIESTEHMADRPGAFREMARVLRPGGRLAVCAWLAAPDATPRQRRRLLEPIRREGRLASLDTPDDHVRWLADAGFSDIALEDLSDRVARTWTVCARKLPGLLLRPATWRYLLDGQATERRFAVTVLRMVAAYRTGSLRYGLLGATRRR